MNLKFVEVPMTLARGDCTDFDCFGGVALRTEPRERKCYDSNTVRGLNTFFASSTFPPDIPKGGYRNDLFISPEIGERFLGFSLYPKEDFSVDGGEDDRCNGGFWDEDESDAHFEEDFKLPGVAIMPDELPESHEAVLNCLTSPDFDKNLSLKSKVLVDLDEDGPNSITPITSELSTFHRFLTFSLLMLPRGKRELSPTTPDKWFPKSVLNQGIGRGARSTRCDAIRMGTITRTFHPRPISYGMIPTNRLFIKSDFFPVEFRMFYAEEEKRRMCVHAFYEEDCSCESFERHATMFYRDRVFCGGQALGSLCAAFHRLFLKCKLRPGVRVTMVVRFRIHVGDNLYRKCKRRVSMLLTLQGCTAMVLGKY